MGRRNLATIDTDMFTPIGRLLQQSMAHGITNDMIYGGLVTGQTALQGRHAVADVQNCMFGTRRVTWDGRVFFYSKCNAERTTGFAMMHNRRASDPGPDIARATNLAVATVIGDTHLHVTVAVTDGTSGAIAENALSGGYLVIFGNDNLRENRQIISNTAVAAPGGECVITIDEGVTAVHPITITNGVEVWGSPDNGVAMLAEDYLSVAGFPAVTVIPMINKFFWDQTWGPVRISAQNFDLGKIAGERAVWFGPDGSIRSDTVKGTTRQRAGYIIPRTSASVGTSPLLMLQLRT